MADNPVLSQITLPSGTTYDLKDATARAAINGIFVIAWNGTAAPTAGNIPEGVIVKYNNTNTTGTKTASADTLGKFYLVRATDQGTDQELLDIYDEYVTVQGGTASAPTYSWEKIGDTQIKLTAMVTGVTLNKQTTDFVTGYSSPGTASVIGGSATLATTYLGATASGGGVTTNAKDEVSAVTGYADPTTQSVVTGVSATTKKLETTSITGVSGSTTASKVSQGTSQTTVKGLKNPTANKNNYLLANVSVSGECLTINSKDLDTQTTTQVTINTASVTVPIAATATTVATGKVADSDANGATVATGANSSGTVQAITGLGTPSTSKVLGTNATFKFSSNQTITLAANSSTATGRVAVATGGWSNKNAQTVLTSLGTKETAKGLNDSTTITVERPS